MSRRMSLEDELRIRREAIADGDRRLTELRTWIAMQPKEVGELRLCQCGTRFTVRADYTGPKCGVCREATRNLGMFGTAG